MRFTPLQAAFCLLSLSATACNNPWQPYGSQSPANDPPAASVVPVQAVKVAPQSVVLVAVGETRQLFVTVSPANATDQAIVWESADTNVVTVNAAGVITAKSVGSGVFITAYSRDRSHQATVNASVNPRAAIEATYDASEHLNTVYATYNAGLLSSRYVFYADSTFALQFNSATFGPFEYGGHFVRTNAGIKLNFDGWNVVGPWEASGIMNADALTVTYNSSMSLSDFIDGVYVLSRMP